MIIASSSTMNVVRLSGVTLTSNDPAGSFQSKMKAGLCFISYCRHASLIAFVNLGRSTGLPLM
jgi:hypothetical protein